MQQSLAPTLNLASIQKFVQNNRLTTDEFGPLWPHFVLHEISQYFKELNDTNKTCLQELLKTHLSPQIEAGLTSVVCPWSITSFF